MAGSVTIGLLSVFIDVSIDLMAGSVTKGWLGVSIDVSIDLMAGSVTMGLLCASTRDKRHDNKTNIINIDFILISNQCDLIA